MSDLNIDAKAISDSLKSTLGDWKDSVKDDVVGYVSAIADGVARVKGLENLPISQTVQMLRTHWTRRLMRSTQISLKMADTETKGFSQKGPSSVWGPSNS